MKILLDEGLPRRAATLLRDLGTDAVIRLVNDHEAALLSGVALSVRAHLVGIRKLPLTELPSEDPEPADEN